MTRQDILENQVNIVYLGIGSNLGNKQYEEKLKLITLAYTQLKNTYKEKIET